MGCDIHIITQIKTGDEWILVNTPDVLKNRNYSTFSVLANVRNDWGVKGFEPKGLPDDLIQKKFNFESSRQHIEKYFNEGTVEMVRLPNGALVDKYDEMVNKIVIGREEADKYGGWVNMGNDRYKVVDPSIVDGKFVNIPFTELYTSIDEFIKEHYEDEWDEDAQDYGYWSIDFDCVDYHSHSYLTLRELQEYDTTSYMTTKVKVPKLFYDKFIEFGGVLPKEMTAEAEGGTGFESLIRQAFCPEIIISFIDKDEKGEETPLIKGIKELEQIAKEHNVDADNLRIVFAFDN